MVEQWVSGTGARYLALLLVLLAGAFPASVQAATEPAAAPQELLAFPDDAMRDRYYELIDQLRCPKCQNQNLADSDAPIASDLRAQVHRLLLEGQGDEQIIDDLTARYGSFVRYSPPLTVGTSVLWLLPAVLLLVGASVLWRSSLRTASAGEVSEAPETDDAPVTMTPVDDGAGRWMLLLGLAIAIPSAAIWLYSPAGGGIGASDQLALRQALSELEQVPIEQREARLREIDAQVTALASRSEQPVLLSLGAQIKTLLADHQGAAAYYASLREQFPEDPSLPALQAQSRFMQSAAEQPPGRFDAASLQALADALAINPEEPLALSLSGMAAFQAGDRTLAADFWRRAIAAYGPGSAEAASIAAALAQTGIEVGTSPADTAAQGLVQLNVAVSDELAALQLPPETRVFVFARAIDQAGPPLAARLLRLGQLPAALSLSDRDTMAGQTLAGHSAVEVTARLSLSGDARAATGDWQSAAVKVPVVMGEQGGSGAMILIDTAL